MINPKMYKKPVVGIGIAALVAVLILIILRARRLLAGVLVAGDGAEQLVGAGIHLAEIQLLGGARLEVGGGLVAVAEALHIDPWLPAAAVTSHGGRSRQARHRAP